jgi:4-carboxymuconolactone decarboxylase
MAETSVYTAVPQFGRLRDEVLYGDVWSQPELGRRDRSLVTCAVLAALGKNAELASHMTLAIENGVTVEELRGLVVQVAFYAGWPCGVNAAKAGMPHFEANPATSTP